MGLGFPISSLLSSFIFLVLLCSTAAEFNKTVCQGEPCTVNGLSGIATYLRKCKSVLNAFRNGSSISAVGYYFFEPIVCCPFNVTAPITTTKSPSITTRTTTTTQTLSTTPTAEEHLYPFCLKSVAEKCKIDNDTEYNIVGGEKINESLYNVALYVNNNTAFENFVCGGTLISERHVVTAAHCLFDKNSNSPINWIRAGVSNINVTGGQSIKISKRLRHPYYSKREMLHHDIAVLELERNVTFDKDVQPACLAHMHIDCMSGNVTGWGSLEFSEPTSPVLRSVIVPITKCESEVEWKFCAGEKGKDACQGDSGGPLIVLKDNVIPTLFGVVAGGPDCGIVPSTFMNASYYVPWIQSIVCPTEDNNQTETRSDP